MSFAVGQHVAVKWLESGASFPATVVSVTPDYQESRAPGTVHVLYDDRIRGQEVYEKNVAADRLELWTGADGDVLIQTEVGNGDIGTVSGGRSATVSSRRVSTSSDAMGLIHRLAQMRDDGDLDVQTVNLTPAQIVQLHDSLTILTSEFPGCLSRCSLLPLICLA